VSFAEWLHGLAPHPNQLARLLGGRGNNTVTASLTSIFGDVLFSEVFSLSADTSFTTIVRSFDLADAATARLSFLSGGPADALGLLLDNVVLSAGGTSTIPAVPEPSTWALLCGGLGVLAAISRRRHKPG